MEQIQAVDTTAYQ